MFTGDFSELSTPIYDPLTKQPFPQNKIPSDRLDPLSLKLLKYYNFANVPSPNPLTNNYVQFNSSPLNRDAFVLRLDYNESSKSQWMGRYSWGDENQTTQTLNLAGTKVITNYEQYTASNTRTFTPNLVNEARFGYSRFYNFLGTLLAFDSDIVSAVGIPNQKSVAPVAWGIPAVTFSGTGFQQLGDGTDAPYANDNNTLQVVDKVSWIRGNHNFRFGFEYNRQNYNQVGNQYPRGQFSFQPNITQSPSRTGGYAFAEFLLGDIYQSTIAAALANGRFQRNVEHAFIDDTWKLTSKLTLSLGLRYELTPPFTDTLGDFFTVGGLKVGFTANAPQSDWPYFVRQGNCTDPYAGLNIHWTQTKAVCGGGLNYNLMETKYKNFAPRIGISYAPNDRTVIRSGWGVFYTQDVGNSMYFDLTRNVGTRITLTSDIGNPNLVWNNAIPGGNGAIIQVPPPYSYVAAYDHATSYTMQYLLNIQRQFGSNWAVETGYLGSESHHLYGFFNANQAVPGTTGNVSSRLPYPTFGVIQLVADGFNGVYNSGSVKVTRRFSQGLNMTGSYTFSKSIDNSSGIRVQGFDTLFPQDSRCARCERALSSFDTRNRFVLGGSYDLPVGRGKLLNINNSLANVLAGGWQTSASTTIQSGVPENIIIGVDNASTGTNAGYDRPIATLASKGYAAHPSPSRWYDPAAFVEAPAGTFGNVGRNSLITPHLQSIDFAVHKQFHMPHSENQIVQFRLEAFNVLNHPTWDKPQANILAGAPFPGAPANAAHQGFGVINATSPAVPMRQIQLALKYSF